MASSDPYDDTSVLPCEMVLVRVNNEKITRDPSSHLRLAAGRRLARSFLVDNRN